MGDRTSSRTAFVDESEKHVPKDGPATAKAEQEAKKTGKLHPLVDPSQYGVIRPSRCRFIQQDNGLWRLTIGTPYAIETRIDTTGSMGNNVDVALRVLPTAFELIQTVLPGCDPQIATGIFGDVQDDFVLCRPQFEALAERIVPQLTYMVPERAGDDWPEDPQYGLFGAAYLTASYLPRIGLKSYDFTVTDAPGREELSETTLVRVFGSEVFAKAKENDWPINKKKLPSTAKIVKDLLTHAHAFLILVGRTDQFWAPIFGKDRMIFVPTTEYLPQTQAAIIGLTEGTLALVDTHTFLTSHGVPERDANAIERSLVNIPIGAQAALPNFSKRPMAGALYREKTDAWPMTPEELAAFDAEPKETSEKAATGGEPADSDGFKWL